jgi:hypothetical protein
MINNVDFRSLANSNTVLNVGLTEVSPTYIGYINFLELPKCPSAYTVVPTNYCKLLLMSLYAI